MVEWSGDQVVRVVRVANLDDMLSQTIGFHALNHQIIEKSLDVTPVTDVREVESRAVFRLSRIRKMFLLPNVLNKST